ncbi:MAG: short-chain dehydrogenase [Proteobacteria bacterium]|nr:MAG: short-chain dehydrogenase [Pseudomonadota bacterium]
MKTLQGKRVLVTGGASGIGRAIAERMAAAGAILELADRNEKALDDAAEALRRSGAPVRTHVVDVTDAGQIAALRAAIHAGGGPVDVLVNNAGLVFGGAFLDVPLEQHMTTYRVNTLGLVAMTHAFLPDLVAGGDGHVVNVASASAFIGLPYGATYASSKWAVLGFSESLALEMELEGHHHVHVTAMCPSYVATGLFDGARPPVGTRLLTAERVAERTVAAVLANRPRVSMPWLAQATPVLKGVAPLRLFYRVAALLRVNTSMLHWRGRPPR